MNTAPELARCLLCGSAGFPGTQCDRCIVPRPVFDDSVVAAKCARCTTPLEILAVGPGVGTRIFACRSCRWAFLPARAWSLLFSDGSLASEIETRVPLPSIRIDEAMPLLACPACAKPMDRARFAATSASIIDVCRMQHGVWVDAGELRNIVSYAPSKDADRPQAHRHHYDVQEQILRQDLPHLGRVKATASRAPSLVLMAIAALLGIGLIVAGMKIVGRDCSGLKEEPEPAEEPAR